MTEDLLNNLLDITFDHTIILEAIKQQKPIKHGDDVIKLSSFIPMFLEFLREKLIPSTDKKQHKLYNSPRQQEKERSRIQQNEIIKNIDKRQTKKSSRISLNYGSSSSPTGNHSPASSLDQISGISPIQKQSKHSGKKSRRQKTTVLRSDTSNETKSSFFELSSFDDFPSMSSISSTPVKKTRRITATPVSLSKKFVNSNQSLGGSSFLEDSNFELSNKDSSMDKVFVDNKRFSKDSTNMSNTEDIFLNAQNDQLFDDAFKRLNITNNTRPLTNNKDVKNMVLHDVDLNDVIERKLIVRFAEIYSTICLQNMVTNITLELNFLFTVLCYSKTAFFKDEIFLPFSNFDGCVYFACKSLERLKSILLLLDIKTLQLITENSRVVKFLPNEFIKSIENCLAHDLSLSKREVMRSIKSPVTGIPFQVNLDNRKSFLSDQHFYAFSKKRDLFYSLIRIWEDNHLDPEWNMKFVLVQKVPEIINIHGNINVLYQFANLFVAQLLELCRSNMSSESGDRSNLSDSVIKEFKKVNPSKFHNLENRFTRPALSHDPCPKPNFSAVEEFFKEFIVAADSHCFAKYVMHVLLSYIDKGDSKSFDTNFHRDFNKSDNQDNITNDILKTLAELRLLAKFLGFVVFLPYKSHNEKESMLLENYRDHINEPMNIKSYLQNSVEKKKTVITFTWVVDFFSMADKNAFKSSLFESTVIFLIQFYVRTLNVINSIFSTLQLMLLLHIGWLFEQPQFQLVNFYQIIENNQHHLHHDDDSITGIDDLVYIDKTALYEMCPYLNDIRRPLADFVKGNSFKVNGSFRKITTIHTSDAFSQDTSGTIRDQLLDSFMKYIPNHIKDTITFISERHFNNIKDQLINSLIPKFADSLMIKMKNDISLAMEKTEDESNTDIDFLKDRYRNIFTMNIEEGRLQYSNELNMYIKTYMNGRISATVKSLLPESAHQQMVETSVKIVKHNIRLKIQDWLKSNRDLLDNSTEVLYNRHFKSIVKSIQDDEKIERYKHCF